MADNNQQEEQQKLYMLDANGALAQRIDNLYSKWFDPSNGNLLTNKDENFSADETLEELTKITRSLRAIISISKEKSAVELNNKFADFLAGDSSAAIDILANREQTDQLYRLICLINVATTVGVLSGELADSGKPIDKGPMKNANVSAQNIEKFVVPVKQSKQMKTPSKFLGDVLPKTFAAVAKHANLARAAEKRSVLFGNEYHNEPTEESMYYNLGQALAFVSTSFFSEANRALTEQGKRLAAGRIIDMDFSRLSAKEQNKLMAVMHASFRKFANYTVELNTLSCINDKMILDSAFAAWYLFMSNQEKEQSGFTEDMLRKMPNAIAFSRKYKTKFDAAYLKFSNKFVDGLTEALKKEQEAVEKTWFENPITGEREFRRGRLAGHGNKFMHTPPMKWLNEKLKQKPWFSFWIFAKLPMLTLNIITSPELRKMRKKLTGTIFAGLRSFAQGAKESFDSTGRSTEITYEDVVKKLKEAEEKLKNLHGEKTVVTNESTELQSVINMLTESDSMQRNRNRLQRVLDSLNTCKRLFNAAMADEAVKSDIDAYYELYDKIARLLERNKLSAKLDQLLADSENNTTPEDVKELAADVKAAYAEFAEDKAELDQKLEKDISSDAHDKYRTDNTLQVGEKSVEICEDVFKTINKYIARQWNLLAAHSNRTEMPLCVDYITIDTQDLVNGAILRQEVHEMTLSDWMENLYLVEADTLYDHGANPNFDHTDAQKQHQQALGSERQSLELGRKFRDARNKHNDNNGQTTAKYPIKYGDKYRYHGLEVKTAKNSDKSGFGIFAERLAKIAEPVDEFCEYVKLLGNESAKKTFDNDKEIDHDSTFKGPLESVDFDAELDKILNEDIGNKIVKATDKLANKVANGGKSIAKGLGKYAGKAAGNIVHGITHTSTEDKDRDIERTLEDYTGLVYKYNRSLQPAYIRDGAKLLAKHSLTNSAKQSFNDINALAEALIEANIANAHSIEAVKTALNTFAEKVKSIKFTPCKTIIDYELADKINKGGINDQIVDDLCMIKGVCIRNFSGAREYTRDLNGKDIDDIFFRQDGEETVREVVGSTAGDPVEEPAVEEPVDEPRIEEPTTEPRTEEPEEHTEETPAEEPRTEEPSEEHTEESPTEEPLNRAKLAKRIAKTIDKSDADSDTVNKLAQRGGNKDYNISTDKTSDEEPSYTYRMTKPNDDIMQRIPKEEWNKMSREERNIARKKGVTDASGKRRTTAKMDDSVDVSALLAQLSEINNINWKDILNG